MSLESAPFILLLPVIILGLAFLYFGGDLLLRGAVELARRLNVSEIVIGLTVVSITTSMPELFTGILAVATDRPELFLGNIIGSNLANIGLILGLAAILSRLSVPSALMQRELPLLLGVTVLFISLSALGGGLGRWDGLVLIILLLGYILLRYFERKALTPELAESLKEEVQIRGFSLTKAILLLVVGLVFLNLGAIFLIEGASQFAYRIGLSEKWIGLTVVAIGTSLPELAASIVGVLKGRFQLILGNLVGSNLINLLFISGVTVMIQPIAISGSWFNVEFVALIIFTTLLFAFCFTKETVDRWEGWVLLVLYASVLYLAEWI